jgi:hypothetical protein
MKRPRRRGRARLVGCYALLLSLVAGCAWFRSAPPLEEKVSLLAVMPLEREEPPAGKEDLLPPGAERVVTAEIYRVLAESHRWRFVPDLAVEQALKTIPQGLSRPEKARALGRAVQADAVLYGSVERFVERKGGEYGASKPASVAFNLALMSVATGEELWRARFSETQQPLSSNLLNFWMFWRGGPRWFTAQELARLGVERVLEDLQRRLPD